MDLIKKCQKFRSLLHSSCQMLPGAYDGLVARTIAKKSFNGCYISGAAISASYGVPDIGLLTLDHFVSRIKEISFASGLPIICDADTGFGEAESVTKTVSDYFHAGACGQLKRITYRRSSLSETMWSFRRKRAYFEQRFCE